MASGRCYGESLLSKLRWWIVLGIYCIPMDVANSANERSSRSSLHPLSSLSDVASQYTGVIVIVAETRVRADGFASDLPKNRYCVHDSSRCFTNATPRSTPAVQLASNSRLDPPAITVKRIACARGANCSVLRTPPQLPGCTRVRARQTSHVGSDRNRISLCQSLSALLTPNPS